MYLEGQKYLNCVNVLLKIVSILSNMQLIVISIFKITGRLCKFEIYKGNLQPVRNVNNEILGCQIL